MLGHEADGDRHIVDILEMENQFKPSEQHQRYRIDPLALLEAEEIAEGQELHLLGIFHSHPDHPPAASEYDRKMAIPWYSYLITSVLGGKAIESKCWRLDNETNRMIEEEVMILDNQESRQ